jgi:hypothetical protein
MDRCEDRRKAPLWCGVRISGLIETLDRLTPAVIMTRPPVQRFAKAIVESTDFSALGTQDRLVLIGFDPRVTGGDTDRCIGSPIQASLRSPNLTSNTFARGEEDAVEYRTFPMPSSPGAMVR